MPERDPVVSVADIDNAPVTLDADVAAQTPEQYAELLNRFTTVSNENFALKGEIETLKAKIRTSEILDALIEPYAKKAYRFMCAYCTFAGIVLLAGGWGWGGVSLSDEVMQILVGSTAVTVIGLVGMVLTGIFVGARKGAS